MSLPSNSVGNCDDVDQELSESKVDDEAQSTTLTEEVDKGDQKKVSFTLLLTKKLIVRLIIVKPSSYEKYSRSNR
uniref:Uncharacterized protein n=1 Tax=Meloidogyne javanica TaxID=6303 RepID=A0A915MPD9_MELJA